MVDTTPRTTTRKPRTKAAATSEAPKAPAKRAPRRAAASTATAPVRKAPTTIAAPRRKNSTFTYVGLGVFFLMFATSAVIGLTADGQINVGNVIIAQGGGHYTAPDGTSVAMPPQQNAQPINSGLVPSSEQPVNVPAPIDTASSTEAASSTETTASSTEPAPQAEGEGEVAGEATTTEIVPQ